MEAMVPRREMPVPLLLRGRRQPLRVLLTPGFPARKQVSAAAFPAPSRHTLASVRVFRSEPLEETADRARILTTANSSGRIQVTALVPRFLQFSIACFVSVATHPVPCVPGFSVLVSLELLQTIDYKLKKTTCFCCCH
ncbi:hypothetical protein ACQ4PT_057269 [Festuca glaucescens]